MTKADLKKLEDRAAKVTIHDNMLFVNIWNGEEWVVEYACSIDAEDRINYNAVVKILMLIENKFTFEPLLIG